MVFIFKNKITGVFFLVKHGATLQNNEKFNDMQPVADAVDMQHAKAIVAVILSKYSNAVYLDPEDADTILNANKNKIAIYT